jgi:hypothetical protein
MPPRLRSFAAAMRSVTGGRCDFVHPAPQTRLGLLNAKFKECFKRNHLKMSSELARLLGR